MSRWWADPESSEEILKSVDDSDVVNGVGTALLGYHGLSMAVLKPLASQTLVDTQVVRNALDGLDLEPIAKALGEATRSEMGEASDRYGWLLAKHIHNEASAATERLLNVWTQTGMAWPNAVERASEVHGVPIERLGRYANVMKSVAVSPLVRADYADRALMEYASVLGRRELASNDLISKQDNVFNENDHPRNPNGKFRVKTDAQAKLDKLNKINRAQKARIREVAPEATKETTSIFGRASNVTSIFGRKQETVAPQKMNNKMNNKMNYRIDVKQDLNNVVRMGGSFDEPLPPGPFPAKLISGDRFIAMHKDDLAAIRAGNSFFVAGRLPTLPFVFTRDDLRDFHTYMFPSAQELIEDYVILRSNYTPIISTGEGMPSKGNFLEHKELAQNARFRVGESNKSATFEIGRNDIQLEMTDLLIDNDEDFDEAHVANHDTLSDYERWMGGSNPPVKKPIKKNLSGSELSEFNEEHPRATNGRFSDKADAQAKLDKLNKINQVNRLRVVGAQQRQADAQKLSEVKQSIFGQQNQNIFGVKEQVTQNEKINNKINNKINSKISSLAYPKNNTGVALDFGNLLGLFVSPNSAYDPNRDLEYILNNGKEFPVGPMLSDAKEGLFVNLIDDFDNDQETMIDFDNPKNPQPIPFIKSYYVQNPAETGLYGSPTAALDKAVEQLDMGAASQPDAGGDYIYQLEAHPVGEMYQAMWVPYVNDPYTIIMGNNEDFDALETGSADLVKIESVERLVDLLDMSTDENARELMIDSGWPERVSNPSVSAYVIKRGHNGGTR